jgi:hypothetical protein
MSTADADDSLAITDRDLKVNANRPARGAKLYR